MLLTTADFSPAPFLGMFVGADADDEARTRAPEDALSRTAAADIVKIHATLGQLTEEERCDFFGRIAIFPATPRIQEFPAHAQPSLRAVEREARAAVFEGLEGWWTDLVIRRLADGKGETVRLQDVTDKLALIADEYKADNLPITFRGKSPTTVDALKDPRAFVEQLRALELTEARIRRAIVDYYPAFEQRSSEACEDLVVSGEA